MTRPLRIGLLKCGHVNDTIASAHGTYTDWFRALLEPQGLELVEYVAVDGDIPASPEEADGWLISGSPLGAWEDHAFIAPLMDFVRATAAAERPLIGICFGHQLVARAFGGQVGPHPGGIKIGRQSYAVAGLGTLALNVWHQDQVAEAPAGAEVIATGPDCRVAGMRIGETVLTLQSHPELTNACLLDIIDARREAGTFAPGQIETAEAGATRPTDAARVAEWFAAFYRARASVPTG